MLILRCPGASANPMQSFRREDEWLWPRGERLLIPYASSLTTSPSYGWTLLTWQGTRATT